MYRKLLGSNWAFGTTILSHLAFGSRNLGADFTVGSLVGANEPTPAKTDSATTPTTQQFSCSRLSAVDFREKMMKLPPMRIANVLRNPLVAFADHKKRRNLRTELLALMAKRAAGIENGLQFEGITLNDPNPESITIMLVLKEICEDRQYSIVNWPGGISLVRTAQVDALSHGDKAMVDFNEENNFIIRGGGDKAANLFKNAATPTGTIKGDK